ncbi:MAG: hypothetical protein WC501_04770 [Candidatus Micrarchaeia archaeon]
MGIELKQKPNDVEKFIEKLTARPVENPDSLAEFFYSKIGLEKAMDLYVNDPSFKKAWNSYFDIKDKKIRTETLYTFFMGGKTGGSYASMFGESFAALFKGSTWEQIGTSISDWYAERSWYSILPLGAWEVMKFMVPVGSAKNLLVNFENNSACKDALNNPTPQKLYFAIKKYQADFLDVVFSALIIGKLAKKGIQITSITLRSDAKVGQVMLKEVEHAIAETKKQLKKEGLSGEALSRADDSLNRIKNIITQNVGDLVRSGKFRRGVNMLLFDSATNVKNFQKILRDITLLGNLSEEQLRQIGMAYLQAKLVLKTSKTVQEAAKAELAMEVKGAEGAVSKNAGRLKELEGKINEFTKVVEDPQSTIGQKTLAQARISAAKKAMEEMASKEVSALIVTSKGGEAVGKAQELLNKYGLKAGMEMIHKKAMVSKTWAAVEKFLKLREEYVKLSDELLQAGSNASDFPAKFLQLASLDSQLSGQLILLFGEGVAQDIFRLSVLSIKSPFIAFEKIIAAHPYLEYLFSPLELYYIMRVSGVLLSRAGIADSQYNMYSIPKRVGPTNLTPEESISKKNLPQQVPETEETPKTRQTPDSVKQVSINSVAYQINSIIYWDTSYSTIYLEKLDKILADFNNTKNGKYKILKNTNPEPKGYTKMETDPKLLSYTIYEKDDGTPQPLPILSNKLTVFEEIIRSISQGKAGEPVSIFGIEIKSQDNNPESDKKRKFLKAWYNFDQIFQAWGESLSQDNEPVVQPKAQTQEETNLQIFEEKIADTTFGDFLEGRPKTKQWLSENLNMDKIDADAIKLLEKMIDGSGFTEDESIKVLFENPLSVLGSVPQGYSNLLKGR